MIDRELERAGAHGRVPPRSPAVLSLAAVSLFIAATLSGCRSPGGEEAESASASTADVASFPPSGIDHLGMNVSVDVEIFAIGRDAITLDGYVAVHRSGPRGAGGKEMEGDLIGASLRGKSAVFGDVVAVESPIQQSPCRYEFEAPGRYSGYFDINAWFWLPAHNLMVFSSKPVRVRGTAAGIPPIGQESETVETETPLYSFSDPGGNPIGTLHRAGGKVGDRVDLDTHLSRASATVPEMKKSE